LNDEIEEVINLLRQMADMGVILDIELTNSILTFLCNSAEHLHVMELLPNFSSESSGGTSISCDELLMKIQSLTQNSKYPLLDIFSSPGDHCCYNTVT
jgi:hypothetical protein